MGTLNVNRRKFLVGIPVIGIQSPKSDNRISQKDIADAACIWSKAAIDSETFENVTVEFLDLVNEYRKEREHGN